MTAASITNAIAIVVGLGGALSFIFVYARVGSLKDNYELMTIANTELRAQNELKRNEITELRVDFTKQMADERADCSKSLGLLQGQLSVLTADFGKNIAVAVLQAFKDGQASMPVTPTPTTPVKL